MDKCYACGSPFKRKGKSDLYCPQCRERETRKDINAFIEPFSDTCLNELACAVLKQAKEDLYIAIRKWHRETETEEKLDALTYLKSEMYWWTSKRFSMIALELDGTKILRSLIMDNEDLTQEEKLFLEKEIY